MKKKEEATLVKSYTNFVVTFPLVVIGAGQFAKQLSDKGDG